MFGVYKYEISVDEYGVSLNGSKQYKCHLPAKIPVKEFWSVLVFDCKTNLLIKTVQSWPSINSKMENLSYCEDGSIDIYFGPKAPEEKEKNWILTLPGKKWRMVVNLYDPLESWINNSWKPGKIEELKMQI
jgi:hypothetical protein